MYDLWHVRIPIPACFPITFCFVFPLIAQKVISEEKDQCFRILNQGSCSLPILRNITKQICCCSRVGKAWGKKCELCPFFGSGKKRFRHSKNALVLSNNYIFNAEIWAKSWKKDGWQRWERFSVLALNIETAWFGFNTKSPTVPQGPVPPTPPAIFLWKRLEEYQRRLNLLCNLSVFV